MILIYNGSDPYPPTLPRKKKQKFLSPPRDERFHRNQAASHINAKIDIEVAGARETGYIPT
jgi:hypothetical protein